MILSHRTSQFTNIYILFFQQSRILEESVAVMQNDVIGGNVVVAVKDFQLMEENH